MEDKSEITMFYFLMGFACIIGSSILKAFLLHSFWNAFIVSFGLLIMSYYLIIIATRIKDKLYVEKNEAISGLIVSQ